MLRIMIAALTVSYVASALPFPQPEERRSKNGILRTSLHVGIGRFVAANLTFTTRMYDGQVPGPTLRVNAGDKLIITLHNDLLPNDPANDCKQDVAPVFSVCAPNTTNLHVHGVHVAPAEDNVNLNVTPGASHEYVFHVPEDHPSGLFWYHPHHIPGDLIQQLGGMSGALIIDPPTSLISERTVLDIPATTIVFQKWLWCRNDTDPCGWDSAGHVVHDSSYYFPAAAEKYDSWLDLAPVPSDWADMGYISVNGAFRPRLAMKAGVLHRLRLLNAATDLELSLHFDDHCLVWLLATDGAWLDNPRRLTSVEASPLVSNNSLVLFIADRAEVAVRCDAAGNFSIESRRFDAKQVDYAGHPAYDEHSMPEDQILMTLDVRPAIGGASVAKAPQPLPALPPRPSWMNDFMGVKPDQVRVRREIWMAGVPSVVGASSPYNYTVVNGVVYNGSAAIAPLVDSIEEWTLRRHPTDCAIRADDSDQCDRIEDGVTVTYDIGSAHVFHMHTQHFQVVRTIPPDATGLDFAVGEFHDTLLFGHNSPDVVIRFIPANYTGDLWYHCHFMKHAVQGMVAKAEMVR